MPAGQAEASASRQARADVNRGRRLSRPRFVCGGGGVKQDMLRKLPSIDELMNTADVSRLANEHERQLIVKLARRAVDSLRSEIKEADDAALARIDTSPEAVAARVVAEVGREFAPSLRHSINATGIVLHTGLGRAVLSKQTSRTWPGCGKKR